MKEIITDSKMSIKDLLFQLDAIEMKKRNMQNMDAYSDSYKKEFIANQDAARAALIEECFTGIDQDITTTIDRSTKKVLAIPAAIPFEQRTYEATVTEQDMEKTDSAKWMEFYTRAITEGNLARKLELRRLMDIRLTIGDPEYIRWFTLRRETMDPLEVELEKLQCDTKALQGTIVMLRQMAEQPFIGKDIAHMQGQFDLYFQQIQLNADNRYKNRSYNN